MICGNHEKEIIVSLIAEFGKPTAPLAGAAFMTTNHIEPLDARWTVANACDYVERFADAGGASHYRLIQAGQPLSEWRKTTALARLHTLGRVSYPRQ